MQCAIVILVILAYFLPLQLWDSQEVGTFISASEETSLKGGACPRSEVGFEFLSVDSKAQVLVHESTNQIQN